LNLTSSYGVLVFLPFDWFHLPGTSTPICEFSSKIINSGLFLRQLSCNKDLVSFHAFSSKKFEAFFLTWCNSHGDDRTSHASGDHKLGLTYWSMTKSTFWRLGRICHTTLGTIILQDVGMFYVLNHCRSLVWKKSWPYKNPRVSIGQNLLLSDNCRSVHHITLAYILSVDNEQGRKSDIEFRFTSLWWPAHFAHSQNLLWTNSM